VKAALAEIREREVTLMLRDGRRLNIPRTQLAPTDLDYLDRLTAAADGRKR
jgi:hypothetical protein